MAKNAIIIGAGPAGLTAAYELLKRTDIVPIILEKSGDIGGISKTVNYKGNRIDIGGHRFFSKSDRVMDWWRNIMPITDTSSSINITYHNQNKEINTNGANPHEGPAGEADKVMLVRKRLSRIYFLRKFFSYPIQLSFDTLSKLGLGRTLGIISSYLKSQLFPRKPESSLEDFLINRFGTKLYKLFFKDYTEKVWGVPCREISAEWGAQRIKGVSISKAIKHAITTALKNKNISSDISQKGVETSLIEQFLYPKLGPGQLWEEVAQQVQAMGGHIHMHTDVNKINIENNQVVSISTTNRINNEVNTFKGEFYFSTMPVQELIAGMGATVPVSVQEVAEGLQYRDFITIGILLKKINAENGPSKEPAQKILPDTWIYIQEKDVQVGRLQIFNNWSPYMVKDPANVWIGMEYFCNKNESFWNLSDENIQRIGIEELEKMGLASVDDVLDSTVLRMEKTYPAYFGTYERFNEIRQFIDGIPNLFLVGRNGMHKYNNSDHSMLTAMVAVDNISEGIETKENIWSINTEQEYHEKKTNTESNTSGSSSFVPKLGRGIVHWPEINNPRLTIFFKNKQARRFLLIWLIGVVVTFAGFKFCYPFADYSNDSYTYIVAGAMNDNISIRPIGYSKFLRAFSALTTSDTILTIFQYAAIEISLLYLFFSIRHFIKLKRSVEVMLFGFLLFNPLILYLANYIGSDCLFTALSIIWLTNLLWILFEPGRYDSVITALLILLILTFRYNALYYPVITAFAFIYSRLDIKKKLVGIGLPIILVGIYIMAVSAETYKKTGAKTFSGFSGWQIASNAMYMYRDTKVDTTWFKSKESIALNTTVKQYFDTLQWKVLPPLATTYFLWHKQAPLKLFYFDYLKQHYYKDSMDGWHALGPLYSSYGYTLIRHNPIGYLTHFLMPNMMEYFNPPLEVFRYYNVGKSTVEVPARSWFRYKDLNVYSRISKQQPYLLAPFPIIFGCLNVLTLLFIPIVAIKKRKGNLPNQFYALFALLGAFSLVNFAFSVVTAPVVLRYQFVAMTTCIVIILLVINCTFSKKLIQQ